MNRMVWLGMLLLAAPDIAPALAQSQRPAAQAPAAPESRDGRRDFDFGIGEWTTELSRLVSPLTGSTEWVQYAGTSLVRPIWDGRASLVELDVEGPAGRIEGLSLRLYNPEARQWSLNYSNSRTGTMSEPVIGEFRNGHGEFFGMDTLDGRAVLVRFVISQIAPDAWRYEQSFSADGGGSWEVNWIAVDTRVDGQ